MTLSEIKSIKGIIRSAFQRAGEEIEEKAGGAMHRYDLRELLFRLYDERSERSSVLSELIELPAGVSGEVGLELFEIAHVFQNFAEFRLGLGQKFIDLLLFTVFFLSRSGRIALLRAVNIKPLGFLG